MARRHHPRSANMTMELDACGSSYTSVGAARKGAWCRATVGRHLLLLSHRCDPVCRDGAGLSVQDQGFALAVAT